MTLEEFNQFSPDYMVCECFDITLKTLLDAIKNGHNTMDTLMNETDAGTACELCQSREIDEDGDRELHLDEILKYANSREG